MMPRWLLIILWGVLVLTIVDGGYLVYLSLDFGNEFTNYEQQGLDGPVLSVLINVLDLVERFVVRHEKFFIILSTIAIAAFTGTLWRATSGLFRMAGKQAEDMKASIAASEKSAQAARDSADAMVNANIPYITPEAKEAAFKAAVGDQPFRPSQYYCFKNYGNSPATIVAFHDYLCLVESLPPEPVYPPHAIGEQTREIVLGIGQESRKFPCGLVIDIGNWKEWRITETELREFETSRNFYLIGRVIYDDVFGWRHTKNYCWRLTLKGDHVSVRPDGGIPYNRRTRGKSPYA